MKESIEIRSGNTHVTLYYDSSQGTYKIGYYEGGARKFIGAGDNRKRAILKAKQKAAAIDGATGIVAIPPAIVPLVSPSIYEPAKPMKVDEVAHEYLQRQVRRMSLPKMGGGITASTVQQANFVCRLIVLLFGGRDIHTITTPEIETAYSDMAAGKLDISSIYLPTSTHRFSAYQAIPISTLNTYFTRMNSIFVYAEKLRAINKGLNPCWAALEGKTLIIKTSQKPYTPEELMRLVPVMELKAPHLVRVVVGILEGIRICEFAIERDINGRKQWVYLTENQITITDRYDDQGNKLYPPKVCVGITKELAKAGRLPGKGRIIELSVYGARYFDKYKGTSHILAPLRVVNTERNGL